MIKVKRILCVFLCAWWAFTGLFAQSYETMWDEVAKARWKDLPQVVINLSEKIFSKAEQEKHVGHMLKACCVWSNYRQKISPDSFYVDLKGLEEWAERVEIKSDKAVLHTVLAGIYSGYARQLIHRNELNDTPYDDIRTWSGKQFAQKVIHHTAVALENNESLFDISSKAYIPFVIQHKGSSHLQHNVYHLLASNGISSLMLISDMADSDTVKKTIYNIYRKLEAHYQQTGNSTGQLIVALDELKKYAYFDNSLTQDDYFKGLDELIAKYGTSEVCTEAYLEKATALNACKRNVEALEVCNEAITRYPGYYRINAVKELKTKLLAPYLKISREKRIYTPGNIVYPGDSIDLNVSHCNLEGFTVHLFRTEEVVTEQELNEVNAEEILKKKAREISSQHFVLKRPADYINTDTTLYLVAPSEGQYIMRVEAGHQEVKPHMKTLFVSRLAIFSSSLPDGRLETVVLDRKTGAPVAGATVNIYDSQYNENASLLVSGLTEADGRVDFKGSNTYRGIKAEKNKDTTMPIHSVDFYGVDNTNAVMVSLLTDRALYYPGQTLYMKGVAYLRNGETTTVVSNRTFTVSLLDQNRKEVTKKELQSNEFGSFTTEFILPAGSVNGVYFLQTESASTMFRIEEYKRPTFEVIFDKPKDTYRPGDSITLKGQARAFSGVPLQDLMVGYTVTPYYFLWGRPISGSPQTDAVTDSVRLNDNGEFFIPMKLSPENVDVFLCCGYFRYEVTATVVALSGETQTGATSIAIGNRSMILNVIFEQEKPLPVFPRLCKERTIMATFTARNLSNVPVEAKGEYALHPFAGEALDTQPFPSVLKGEFTANHKMELTGFQHIPSGKYTLILSSTDDLGRAVNHESTLTIFSATDTRPPVKSNTWLVVDQGEFDRDTPASFAFGTSFKEAYVLVDMFAGNRRVKKELMLLSDTIVRFTIPYEASYGNGMSVNLFFVKEGHEYQETVRLERKRPDDSLTLFWSAFRDKLRPGQEEEWRLTVKHADGTPAQAELLATMYDASLDKLFRRGHALNNFTFYYPIPIYYRFRNTRYFVNNFYINLIPEELPLKPLLFDEFLPWGHIGYQSPVIKMVGYSIPIRHADIEPPPHTQSEGALRTRFEETAFFYPQLRTNAEGEAVVSFTVPESLTRWNFNAYAHTKEMSTGIISEKITVSKEFMITPHMPRFVRVGDKSSVGAAVINLSGETCSGEVTFILFDPLSGKVIDTQQQSFTAEAGKHTAVAFAFTTTGDNQILGCRMLAKSGSFSDGEQHLIPVLSSKEQVIETVAMPIRGKQSVTFELKHLFNEGSKTATNRRMTVEFSGNPVWYAIQALPALSVSENNSAIALASAYYANTLAAYIVNSQPEIKEMFDLWSKRGETKETFMSNLQKNQEMKQILLNASPWMMEASTEQEQMQRIATLFDLNTITYNNYSALNKLKALQQRDGAFQWFEGMPGSDYVTYYVAELFIRLQQLTGEQPTGEIQEMLRKAFDFLHYLNNEVYKFIKKSGRTTETFISYNMLHYLYLIALSGQPVPENNMEAYHYYMNILKNAPYQNSLSRKAMSAVVFQRAGYMKASKTIAESIKQYLTYDKVKGAFFEYGAAPVYTWGDQMIPMHVKAIEVLEALGEDAGVIEEMKLWLLAQKKTQQWSSPVSTVNAVYALLHNNENLSFDKGNVRIKIGKKTLETRSTSALHGVSYIKETITDPDVLAKAKQVVVAKRDVGMAWGAVYASYEEELSKVKTSAGGLQV